ncbi:uncharacterized protein CXQ87_004584 [Candidozyma duobushaemuli]|uniref:Telomere-associated protein Rif1 N-terminal domain-containing protein n=1 Tax=Candidozyma duobushaemuli TaxID=1231522 RepID=A0A2V1AH17_9ASCO|nr:uncharacterized protein CXQ87_004584 [[Candida] duobushaemulonis]PVH17025.1 hypothetical protein CXQ87_004584 [[Candida] duobushaemulonis]
MTSVVSSDSQRSPNLDPGAKFPRFSPPKNQKKSSTPSQHRSPRPRTRSSVLKASSRASLAGKSTPRRRKSQKKTSQDSREASPMIDLTEEEIPPPIAQTPEEDDESPLRNNKRRKTNELNSSPIKATGNRVMAPPSSSPVRRRKVVTFSDDMVPSSPMKNMETPRKSILKNSAPFMADSSPLDPNNSSMWMKTAHSISHSFSTEFHSPNNPAFWQPGTIIQLEPRSNDLPQLIDGCMEVLQLESFDRKFEVYATLNQICKLNDASVLAELFLGGDVPWLQHTEKCTRYKPRSNPDYIRDMFTYLRRDVLATEEALLSKPPQAKLSPTRNNPFQSRVLNQALKFAAHLLMSPSVNRHIPMADVQWIYSHTCKRIVSPTISKSLVLPYMSIIKDCHFAPKRRRAIFENLSNPISEQMLSALLNIRNFGSSSLVNEKFIALKNMLSNFPNLMAKNFHLWFIGLVLNLCDTSFPLYTKVVSTGITALLEAARNFLDNPDICFAGRKFLESPLPQSQNSFTSDNLISISTSPTSLTIDFVIESLLDLIQNGHFKFAMDIWVGLTLLCGKFDNGFENWKYLTKWLQVHKYCFNESDMMAKVTAISSWKVVVYKICCIDLRDTRFLTSQDKPGATENQRAGGNDDTYKTKVKLLIHIFVNITSIESQREIIDALHNSFMSILYNLFNGPAKASAKLQDFYWDKIIFPVLVNFYFKKDSSSHYMHSLGLGIIERLIKATSSTNDRNFSSIRCLSNESIQLQEIHSLNPRWVFVRFDKVMQTLAVLVRSDKLEIEPKINVMNHFLNTLKFVTKKEAQISDTTKDIIDNLPITMNILSKNTKISYDSLFKLLVNLNDTFGARNLMNDSDIDSSSCYEVLLLNSIQYYTSHQLNGVVSMVHGAIGDRFYILFTYQLVRINSKHKRGDLESYIADCLNSKRINKLSGSEMIIAGRMLKHLESDFSLIAKKIIQHTVLLKPAEFEDMVGHLCIKDWKNQVFKFFLGLLHDAPHEHLRRTSLNLLRQKWAKLDDFKELLAYLLDNKFDFEIEACFAEVMQKISKLEGNERTALEDSVSNYLLSSSRDDSKLDSLLVVAHENGVDYSSLVKENLSKYPRFSSLLNVPSSLESSNSSSKPSQEKSSLDEVSQQQKALESLITKALDVHTKDIDKKTDEKENTADQPPSIAENKESQDQKETSQTTVTPVKPLNESKDVQTTPSVQATNAETSSQRRRTRRMAAKEREELSSQKVVEVPSDDSRQEESATVTTPGAEAKTANDQEDIQEIERDDFSFEKNNESDAIDDSAETEDSEKSKKRKHEEEPASPRKKHEHEKQVSDSEESLKEKRLGYHEGTDVEVNSSTDSNEKKANDSVISDSSEKPFSDTFLNSSSGKEEAISNCTELVLSSHAQAKLQSSAAPEPLSAIPEVVEKSVVSDLIDRMEATSNEELANVTQADRHNLETAMMEFMLRMRKAAK